MADLTPWSSAATFVNTSSAWVPNDHIDRIKAYMAYESFYWNQLGAFKVNLRGSNEQPIYVPAPRTIIETCNRYTAPGIRLTADPEFGTPAERQATALAFRSLLDRERFRSRFNSAKRYGLVHGDWAFHITADPNRPAGRRLSIETLEVGRVFPIPHPEDEQEIIGYHLVTPIVDSATGDTTIERQTYSYNQIWNEPGAEGDNKIYSSLGMFKVDEWHDITKAPLQWELPVSPLPDAITSFPVYWIANQERPKFFYGSSELRGFEAVLLGLNQAISDEDLTLAMEGIGMYATTAEAPVDRESGRELPWRLGPGRVVELKGDSAKVGDMWQRINGVGSLSPYQQHIQMLRDSLYEAAPAPEVARGIVDVQVAESGVALALQMSPILAHTDEKDDSLSSVLVQMFYDLKSWFGVYEEALPEAPLMVPTFTDKLPQNRDAQVSQVLQIVAAQIGSPDWGRAELAKLGYTFAEDEANLVVEALAAQAMASDSYALRTDAELARKDAGGAEA
jgi:hypothetical protein